MRINEQGQNEVQNSTMIIYFQVRLHIKFKFIDLMTMSHYRNLKKKKICFFF